jgi:hypothetical protein
MATVYEAVAEGAAGFERRVAIKRILPQHAGDEEYRRRFLDEARIASHLHHGGIVQVLDFGLAGESEFIVYELVDGIDAGRAARRGRERGRGMPVGVALHLLGELAEALDHAHHAVDARGRPLRVVHRDVSPGNVLLSWAGDVKLSDFGVAWAAHARSHRTETGLVHGKLDYMAPEQAAALPVDGAADVYALGRTVAALLVGEEALARPGSRWWEAAGEAAGLVDVLREAGQPEPVVALVAACTRPEPASRPTARRVAEEAHRLARALHLEDGGGDPGEGSPDLAGRAGLRRWLAPLRRSSVAASAFDEGLGLVLERLAGGGDDDPDPSTPPGTPPAPAVGLGTTGRWRPGLADPSRSAPGSRFAVTRTAAAPPATLPPNAPGPSDPGPGAEAKDEPPGMTPGSIPAVPDGRGGRRLWAGLAAAVCLGGLGAIGLGRVLEEPATERAQGAAAAVDGKTSGGEARGRPGEGRRRTANGRGPSVEAVPRREADGSADRAAAAASNDPEGDPGIPASSPRRRGRPPDTAAGGPQTRRRPRPLDETAPRWASPTPSDGPRRRPLPRSRGAIGGGDGEVPGTGSGRRGTADEEPPRAADPTPALRRAWLRVGGETLARARVEVDGRFQGHAPLELELPVGPHRVVVSRGSTRLLEETVVLRASHRRVAPARLVR